MVLVILIFSITISLFYFFTDKPKFLFLFIFFSLLLPSGIGIITGGITLNYVRISSVVFSLLTILFSNSKQKRKYFSYYIILFNLFIIIELISSYYSKYNFWVYTGYILDDFFQTVGFIIILSFYLDKKYLSDRTAIILKSVIYVTFIASLTGIFEILSKINIYKILGIYNELNISFFGDFYRDSFLRISGTFNQSLFFGYFIALVLPFMFIALKRFKSNKLFINLIYFNIILSPLLIYFISSRTASLMYLFSIGLILIHKLILKKINTIAMRFIFFLTVFMILILSVTSFNYIFNTTNSLIGTNRDVYNDESLNARDKQVDYVFKMSKISENFLGDGRINTFQLIYNTNYLQALDSYWIRIFIESGIIAIFFMLLVFITPIVNLIKLIIFKPGDIFKEFYLLIFIISYFIMLTFSSNQELRPLFFIYLFIYTAVTNKKLNWHEDKAMLIK